jgi:hypothetical protein
MKETLSAYREPGSERSLVNLDTIRAARSCDASWSQMLGNGRVRLCRNCGTKAFDLSAMMRADSEALLREHGKEATPLYRRTDGILLSANCSFGPRARLRRTARLVVIFTATVLAGASAIAGYRFLTRDPDVGDAKSCGDFAPDPECERAQKERQFERYLRNHPLPP